jgi:hypothetical protein
MAEKKKLQGRSSSQDSPAHIRNARGNNFKVWGKDEDAWANEEFQSNQLAQQLRKAKRQKETLLEQDGNDALSKTRELLGILTYGPEYLEAFDGELFRELVDKIVVESNERIRFRLINGLELPEEIERTVR